MSIAISRTVAWQKIDGYVYIQHEDSEDCYFLTGVGAEIWEFLSEGMSNHQIEHEILEQYDTSLAEVSELVKLLLNQLEKAGVVNG